MGFADRYVHALCASSLKDDERNHQAEPLAASGLAALSFNDLGPLLHRVKYADGVTHKMFESGTANLAQLIELWTAEVIKRGRARKWVPENTAWDAEAAQKLYRRVAEASLAYWLDGQCDFCHGTKVRPGTNLKCTECNGTGKAPILIAGGFERQKVEDMIGELECIATGHSGRASKKLRRGE